MVLELLDVVDITCTVGIASDFETRQLGVGMAVGLEHICLDDRCVWCKCERERIRWHRVTRAFRLDVALPMESKLEEASPGVSAARVSSILLGARRRCHK